MAFSRECSKKVEALCFDPFFEGNTGVDDVLVGSRYMYIADICIYTHDETHWNCIIGLSSISSYT